MIIHIAHLYYDLMNLYGESGNIKALKMQLENQGIKVKIDFLTITDTLRFSDYDFVYIGMGTEQNQQIILKHLSPYKKEIEKAIEDGTFFLVTGNALELFGKYIITNKKIKGLNIFSFETRQQELRIVEECIGNTSFINKPILGFQNRCGVMQNVKEDSFLTLTKGTGYAPKTIQEGIVKNHFYGTYLVGPILIRNPELLKYFVKQLILEFDSKFQFKPFHLTLENKAYQTFMEKYQLKN